MININYINDRLNSRLKIKRNNEHIKYIYYNYYLI